jgi:purine-nucleoside phosphorylase
MLELRSYFQQIQEATAYVHGKCADLIDSVEIGIVLGSGLGELAEQVQAAVRIPFTQIPYFPQSTVEGHVGQLVIGRFAGKQVVMLQGRFHYYEGYSMKQVVLPIYVMKQLGIRSLLVTNAAGGMNPAFQPGDFMIIRDHLNMTGDHPLLGPNDERLGVRFPDMSTAYDPLFLSEIERMGASFVEKDAPKIHQGVYAGISGPSYMTPSELIMLARCGADAVGMSTVAEVIAARHCQLRVLGISCITDMAIGKQLEPLTHEQVMNVANRSKPYFKRLVESFVEGI